MKNSEVFIPQTNGEVSDSLTQNWTQQACECYSINCDCKKCSLEISSYSFVCQMPKIVSMLLQTQGEPQKRAI